MALCFVKSFIILGVIAQARTQFFDFFQGLQPYPQSYTTNRPSIKYYTSIESHTRNPYSDNKHDRYINVEELNKEAEETIKRVPVYNNDKTERDRVTKEKHKSTISIFNIFTTTVKPLRKVNKSSQDHNNENSSRKHNNNVNSRKKTGDSNVVSNSKQIPHKTDDNLAHNDNNANSRQNVRNEAENRPVNSKIPSQIQDTDSVAEEVNRYWNDGHNAVNNVDYYTQRPTLATRRNNFDTNYNYRPISRGFTTQNPLVRPGVKPAVIDNRPPITNRPPTVWPDIEDRRPIVYNTEHVPEIIPGPDESLMSDAEKRRYIELAERMCDQYRALNTKQLQAIPLVPSPEPVEVNVTSCTPTNVPLVVGGKVVEIKEFPHMALLGWLKLNGNGYSWKCGGTLISDQYVLTAAHCAYQERDNTVSSGPPRAVQLGSSFLDDPGALVMKVSLVVRHPKYKLPRSYHDLALLKLMAPVSFSEVIKPACLGVPPGVGEPIIATGWGRTEFGGDQSLELRSVSLPIWDLEECANVLGTSRKMPDGPSVDSQICAGEMKGGKDTCQGDSGGPAQIQDDCQWRVIAVTSLGRSCGAPKTPGLYAIVQRAFVAAVAFGPQNLYNKQNNNQQDNRSNVNYNTNQRGRSNNRQNVNNNQRNNNNYGSNQQEISYGQNMNNNNFNSNQQSTNNGQNMQNNNRNNNYNSNQGGRNMQQNYNGVSSSANAHSYYNPQQNGNRRSSNQQSFNNRPGYNQQSNRNDYYRPNNYGLFNPPRNVFYPSW